MKTEYGFVDVGFRPSLRGYQTSEDSRFVSDWKVPDGAIPSTLPEKGYKAAVWIGRACSVFGESPIIAVALPSERYLEYYGDHWFVGAENFAWDAGEFGKASSEIELAKNAIDGAIHGPYTHYAAMVLLKNFMLSQSDQQIA